MKAQLIVLMFFASVIVHAQPTATLEGRVFDGASKRGLEGANILVQGTSLGTAAAKDGSFRLSQIPAGEHIVNVTYVGYTKKALTVTLREGEVQTLNVPLDQTILPGQTIVITATRGRERETPVTFSTVSARDLAERYSTQDIPQLLSELPSATFYSENGNGIGYNYVNIRGFDQRRISVMINGIPQNDPEDHNVYWLDFPDLAANLQDIQLQRGAGSAFYGPPAIGGSVNLVTSNFSGLPGIQLYSGVGSYNTRKYSVAVQSGLVGEQYQIYGRLSRILSDGYRENSWTDFSSYFLGAVRYDESMTTQFNFFGGPVADHLAYYGIAKADAYSSDSERRRQNPIARPEEIENFSQPHYELLHEWRLADNLTLNNSLFLITGDGFFDYDGSWAPYSYYRITKENGFDVSGDPDNLYIPNALIRAFVSNTQYGWLPRISWKHQDGELTAGVEARIHRSFHWGALRWGENLPAGVTPDYHYYEYRGAKDILSLYARELYRLRDDLTLSLDLQYAYNKYRLYEEKYVGTDFSVPYHFLNPRIGINYNISDRINIYTQVSYTSREPRLKNLYDAAEASTPASWGPVTPQFRTLPDGRYDFDDPLVKPEALLNVELGAGYTTDQFRATVNLYHMDFTDEIIKKGQLDRFGQPVTGNAPKTLHQGLEVTGWLRLTDELELQGNASLSRNRLEEYTVYSKGKPQSLNGNTIAGFPEFLANARLTYRREGLLFSLAMQHVGEFYTDNFQDPGKTAPDPERTVDAYTVFNTWVGYTFDIPSLVKEAEARVQVNNLFNNYYASNGSGAEFFPAADRNIFASLRINL